MTFFHRFYPILWLLLFPASISAQWQSSIAFQDADGRMHYHRDAEGNMIPNFSHAGYRGGGVALPMVPAKITIGPITGDNTAHIQAAIDQVSAMAPDSNGFRGAVLLDTGRYEIHGTIHIAASGVVLRGMGDGAATDSNTVLIGVGDTPHQRTIIEAGGGGNTRWGGRVANTKVDITTERVLVGDYQLKVANPSSFSPGDNIVINHPCTQAWLDAIDGGGSVTEPAWSLGSQPLIFNRRIVSIEDSVITLDVPLYNTLDRSLAQSYIYTYDRAGLVTEVGVENLRIDIETAGGDDENHAWDAVGLIQVEDAWVTGCTFLHFGLAGVYTTTASRITIEDCRALDPVAQITGARMYNFNLVQASSQVLIRNCHARNGRHHYVSNGTSSVSGCVFLRCTSEDAYATSEGHRRWSMGLLYDIHRETSIRNSGAILLGLYNRGDYGTSHGWAAAHSVAWNCDMKGARLVVQKPPTAQNYAIGCTGVVNGNGPFPGPPGFIEGTGETDMAPESLYEAQLAARQAGLEPVITVESGTGIGENGPAPSWQVFPNPSRGELRIHPPVNQPFEGEIRDLTGRLVHQFSGQAVLVEDLSSLPGGTYQIGLTQSGERSWMRWVKW